MTPRHHEIRTRQAYRWIELRTRKGYRPCAGSGSRLTDVFEAQHLVAERLYDLLGETCVPRRPRGIVRREFDCAVQRLKFADRDGAQFIVVHGRITAIASNCVRSASRSLVIAFVQGSGA